MPAIHNRTPGVRWTDDEKTFAAESYRAGMSDTEIGDALKRTAVSVSSFRRAHGLVETKPKSVDSVGAIRQGWGRLYPDEIGAHLGMTAAHVCQIARIHGLGDHGLPKRAVALPCPTPVKPSAGDTTLGVYKAAAGAGANTSTTITVYQDYLDQIPYGAQGPILPILDLSTIYELKQTIFTSMTAGQDFPMQYSNFRDFLSTMVVYFNGTARVAGADINYWALQSANFTNIWKMEPSLVALRTRQLITTDYPLGVYYFGSRNKPIATTQYGNMELILNSITAGASAYALVAYEDFALVNTITQAGSLPAS